MENRSDHDWIVVKLELPQEMVDPAANFMHEQGSTGIVFDDSEDDIVKVDAYFPDEMLIQIIMLIPPFLAELKELFGISEEISFEIEQIKKENWAVMWKDNFKTLHIGKSLIVTPPWLVPDDKSKHVIIIEPAEAFGTGTHETTQMCMVFLEQAANALRGSDFSVLDLGCGSGILAIAAVKLGAARVSAVDNDPIASESAKKNAELNGAAHSIAISCKAVQDLTESADIVVANLDTRTLLANKSKIASLFGKFLILSGITVDQWEQVLEGFSEEGPILKNVEHRAEWTSALFVK